MLSEASNVVLAATDAVQSLVEFILLRIATNHNETLVSDEAEETVDRH